MMKLSERLESRLKLACDLIYSLVFLCGIAALIYQAFSGFVWLIELAVPNFPTWAIVALWCLLGVVGTLYWPFKYRHNMAGHWSGFFKVHFWMPIAGPFAFMLCIPL